MTEADTEQAGPMIDENGSRSHAVPVGTPSAIRRVAYRFVDHRVGALACVFAGGAVGTAARETIGLAWPTIGVPYATGAINVLGALVLGLLTGMLTGRVRHRHRGLRLLLGTGFCGGFTTYSTLAEQSADLAGHGLWGSGVLYALGTLLIGAVAAWAGIAAGAAAARRREMTDTAGAAR